MKKSLLSFLGIAITIFFVLSSNLRGQTVLLSEDFTGFTAGTHASPSGTDVSVSLDGKTLIPGWTGSKIYEAGGEIKSGTSSVVGFIETPAIDLSANGGNFTVKFDIARWTGDVTTVQVYVNGTTAIGSVISPTDSYQTIQISGSGGTSTSKIKVAALTKRFYLDNFFVTLDATAPVPVFLPANAAANVAITVSPTITFDESILKTDGSEVTDGDLATLVTFKKTDAAGVNVSFAATIDATKKIITITPAAPLDNSQVYYLAIGAVKDASGNQSAGSNATFTTVAVGIPTVTLTNPVGGETFYANDPVSFTWTSENITYLQMEVWVPDPMTQTYDWEPLGIPIPAVAGKLDFIIPADAPYGSGYKIRISDAGNPAVNSTSGVFTLIAVASSITDLRVRCIVNDIVRLSSEATVTYLRTNRFQKYIQDSGKGLLIDDAAHILTTTLAPGDNIAGLEGKLALYHGVLELVPTKSSVTIASSGNIVTPPQMTIADYKTSYLNFESMLIKLTNVTFDAGNGTATFAAATNYQISDGANSVTFRTFNADETDIDGEIIPVSPLNMTCIAGFFDATIQVYSQTKSEFELITAIERTSDLKTEIYPVPATEMLKVRNLKDIKDYEILDATGRTISKSKVATDNELNIPVSELKNGIYFVRFNTSSGIVVKKFVK